MKNYKIIIVIILLVSLITAGVCVGLYQSKYKLQVSNYTTSSELIDQSIRIVQLSDIHNSVFGDDNQKLIELVQDQNPDILLVTGDLINSDETSTETAIDLISSLHQIAPVYISLGNHEKEYQENFGIDITQLYEEAGAVVMDYQYEDIAIRGQRIRLGGIYGYCLPAKYLETKEADPEECAFLSVFQNTDLCSILMCHMPVCWIENEGIEEWDIDMIFAGHAHGGQIRIPLIGGLWAPDQSWFPGKESGLYYSSDGSKVMVLSRGLGSNEKLPRFNNVPEVVVVDVNPM